MVLNERTELQRTSLGFRQSHEVVDDGELSEREDSKCEHLIEHRVQEERSANSMQSESYMDWRDFIAETSSCCSSAVHKLNNNMLAKLLLGIILLFSIATGAIFFTGSSQVDNGDEVVER